MTFVHVEISQLVTVTADVDGEASPVPMTVLGNDLASESLEVLPSTVTGQKTADNDNVVKLTNLSKYHVWVVLFRPEDYEEGQMPDTGPVANRRILKEGEDIVLAIDAGHAVAIQRVEM